MALHARKSASGSKRWINCPGSLALVASMDPSLLRPTGSAAMLGTCAHGLGEHLLRHGKRVVEGEWLGTVIWLDQNEDAHVHGMDLDKALEAVETTSQLSAHLGEDVKFWTRVDEKMQAGVQLYLDTVWADHDEMGDTVEMSVEQRFDLTWLRPDMFGTSDCTLYQFLGLLRVVDYKNGYVTVQATDNTQGMYYALGEAHRVEWMFDEVEVVIVQPNSKDGVPVKRFRLTRAELEAFRDLLAAASDLADAACEALDACEDEVDFREWAGEYLDAEKDDGDHCTFCDAFATCPAAANRAAALAQADFADDPPDDNELSVTDEAGLRRLSELVRWAGYLDKLVKAAKTLGQRRLEQGLEMPGQKLVLGKANRQWVNTEHEIATLLMADKDLGLTEDKVYEEPKPRKIRSPAQMEKLGKKVKERVNGIWDPEANDGEGDWVKGKGPLAVKPLGKVTMAPESDPREAVIPGDAADDFVDDVDHDYGGESE